MSKPQSLSEDEAHAMRLLWDRGGASVSELARASRQPASATLSILQRLRRKGAVERQQSGRDVRYLPRLNRQTAPTHTLGRLLSEAAGDDRTGLGVVVLRESDVDPQDWADLQAEIAAKNAARSNR
ncbi:BlaI/MecI/CopY family transcriptional regulator [Maricaulis salignorans]|uniref:Predicted transcriptional regulator n=1 Tax=Maricaulis salignorans TaxID=144026 RepID=A0A1G9WEJ6_9PROT|nr:BlaI/MecI/CopY family transcriptional regulator [Maricaulis salignorans]SDM82972.1 Predicted transcriptional regulator [Maricaulis salignorans]